jgi:hypothetical protein
MTTSEARAFTARWRRANDRERAELRATPPLVKLQQVATLMRWASELGWANTLASGEEEVRQRWNRLRKAYGV